MRQRDVLASCRCRLAIRVWLIFTYPIVFGGDTIIRLANSERILLGHNLPLLQLLVYLLAKVTGDLIAFRVLMGILGAAAGVGFYLMAEHLMPRNHALATALLLATNPFLVEISIVPFQEVLMLALLCFALHFYWSERLPWASLCLGLACLTRYEAWIVVPILVWNYSTEREMRWQDVRNGILIFGWAPLGWISLQQGLSGPGTIVIERPPSVFRFARWAYLAWITVKNTPIPVLLLAVPGLWQIFEYKLYRDKRMQILIAFALLLLISILCSAHGTMPEPERFVTSREATPLIAATVLLAGFGLGFKTRFPIATLLVIFGLVFGTIDSYLARAARYL